MSKISQGSQPLIVVVAGGGPVALTFSLHLTMMMGKHVKIIMYEGRWFVDERHGKIAWQGKEQGKTRREQVVTLQDHVIEQMPDYVQKGLFQNINERVWPTSRNIPIREVEDRLFDLIQPFVANGQIELIPENLNEQSEHLLKGSVDLIFIHNQPCLLAGSFDILVGADGAGSFVRQYCNIQMISEGSEYACGVAYNIPKDVPPSEEPLHQALNCVLTISQTRFLVNSSTSRRGYLNIRLIQSEYDALREDLKAFQASRSPDEPLDLSNTDYFPESPLWTMVRQGLKFFKISHKYVFTVVPIEINVRHASVVVRELRFEIKKTERESRENERKKYKTALAFLVGDAAMNVHFWPGRGMNSGMKAAMALTRNILRSCTSNNSIQIRPSLPFLDFLEYEGFMARLRAREQQGRSLRVLIDPIGQYIEASHSYAYTLHCHVTYSRRLVAKLTETRDRLQGRPEWPHKGKSLTDTELESAVKRITAEAIAQLTLANPWPTREMSGADVLVESTYPFHLKSFLPVPREHAVPAHFRSVKRTIRRIVFLWIVDARRLESVRTLTRDIGALENRETICQGEIVQTPKDAEEWVRKNKDLLKQLDVNFKVITLWELENNQTAVDVIVAVRKELPQVFVIVFSSDRNALQPLSEFNSVKVTGDESELRELVGIEQASPWVFESPRESTITTASSVEPATSKSALFKDFVVQKDKPSTNLFSEEPPDTPVERQPPYGVSGKVPHCHGNACAKCKKCCDWYYTGDMKRDLNDYIRDKRNNGIRDGSRWEPSNAMVTCHYGFLHDTRSCGYFYYDSICRCWQHVT